MQRLPPKDKSPSTLGILLLLNHSFGLERFCDLQVVSINLEDITALDTSPAFDCGFLIIHYMGGGAGGVCGGTPTIKAFQISSRGTVKHEFGGSQLSHGYSSFGHIAASFPGCFQGAT